MMPHRFSPHGNDDFETKPLVNSPLTHEPDPDLHPGRLLAISTSRTSYIICAIATLSALFMLLFVTRGVMVHPKITDPVYPDPFLGLSARQS
ncbi:hypothetical protein BDZ94DRAFT_1248010 [Collybia nuda]|uniref:Uncharacterized protein n=1 Tax=Collybia nuda TaxID=64659 RepID=A0A9P5YDC0_9AGAR|nr:hypothetical protein BDZ94DRAFT_1248010 [Collybia nuda]